MCWYIKLSFTILSNLVTRLCNDFVDFLYLFCWKLKSEDQYVCSTTIEPATPDGGINTLDCLEQKFSFHPSPSTISLISMESNNSIKITIQYNEYRLIEFQPFFRAVSRETCEQILCNRMDGSCLVRPYKESNTHIKYITSIYAKSNYFHLYIRETSTGKYSLGLEKPKEKLFNSPLDIINYYKLNKLQCTNKFISICIFLIPIK